VEVGIDSVPISDEDVDTAQNHHFRTRALLEPDTKEVVPQIEVGLNTHVGLTHGHKGRYVQDPRGGQVKQLQAIKLQQRAEKSV
jgi:hypothetical protein